MASDLEALLQHFVDACLEVFGEDRVEAVILHGSALKGGIIRGLPEQAKPTPDGLRASSRRFLSDTLPQYVSRDLGGFVDAPDDTLPRRVRLLGTSVMPTIFSLLACDAEDPMQVWALPKFEALDRLEERYGETEGPALARRFYENVQRLYGGEFDADLGRQTFRTGIAFLRWAQGTSVSSAGPD